MSENKPESGTETTKQLTQSERTEAVDIANGQADVTRDGGKRSGKWKEFLVDPDEESAERPYK